MSDHRTTWNRASFDVKTGSKIKGTPYACCWQNQSGYRYHSATFIPALGILHAGYYPVADPLEGWTPMLLQHGAFHEGHKPTASFTRGLGTILYWLKSLTLHSIGKPVKHRVGGYT